MARVTNASDPGDDVIYAFRRNVVVAASAGTGKTHRLTALYLLLALGLTSRGQRDGATKTDALAPDRIVATTFSRAAAREIATRIERSLIHLAALEEGSEFPFEDVIRGRMNALSTPLSLATIRARAEEARLAWSTSRIDTLHGVAAQIALGNALTLGLPPDASVLDQEESEALADAAIDEALGAALTAGGEPAEAARALIAACSGVAFARIAVTKLLDRLDEEGLSPRDLALADHAGAAKAITLELVRATRAVASGGTEPFLTPAKALSKAFGDATREPEFDVFPDVAITPLIDLFGTRVPPKKKRTSADDALAELRDGLPGKNNRERALQLIAMLRETPRLAAREVGIVALLDDVRDRLIRERRRRGALSFGDLLRRARDGLRDVPEVSDAARGSIDVLLVDEFQDSSRVQRDLVYLLRERDDAAQARRAGASPSAAGLSPHGLFLVGDRKQSIYGFRGADVAVFSRICVELAGRAAADALFIPMDEEQGCASVADFVALRESRRSGEAILSFVNAFSERDFARGRDAEPRDFEIAYGPAEHLVAVPADPQKPERPRGSVVFIRDDGAIPEDAPPLLRDAHGPAREGFVAASFVARLVRTGEGRAGEIAVLARRRSTLPFVELGLSRLEIPYVVAGRALYDAREIRDVAAILRLLLDPRDRLALATVLRGPVVALSDASLGALAEPKRGIELPLVAPALSGGGRGKDEAEDAFRLRLAKLVPDERARLKTFRDRFVGLRAAVMRLPPADAIRAAIETLDLDQVIAALPRPEARLGNIDRLSGIARRRGGSLASFVRWLEQRIADEADEAEAAVFSPDDDAVRLTTIHASKGLDFPIVVLVDLNAEPRAGNAGVTFAPSEGGQATLAFRHVGVHPERDGRDPERAWVPEEPLAFSTAALRDARTIGRMREQAERCRLTYVAITRPRRSLVLIGTPKTARQGSALSTLTTGLEDGSLEAHVTAFEDAASLLDEAEREKAPPPPVAPAIVAAPARPAVSPCERLAIATTPLGLFRGCARRFRLRQLLGIDEPVVSGQLDLFDEGGKMRETPSFQPDLEDVADPRALGRAAHRLLERAPLEAWGPGAAIPDLLAQLRIEGLADDAETRAIAADVAAFLKGPYAASLGREGATLFREEELVLEVEAGGARTLALRGAIDLLACHADGAVDVIDYKRSNPRVDLSPYEFQLRAYALAAQRRFPERRVRAGVVFLGARQEPVFLRAKGEGGAITSDEHAAFQSHLADLAARFAEARYEDRWEGVPLARCRELHCGFASVCHPEEPRSRGKR